MRIGLLIPAIFATTGPGNGVWVQADAQARALERLGHDVLRLNPWQPFTGPRLDVAHVYFGGFPLQNFHWLCRHVADRVGFAPFIDSNEPNWRYRLAAMLGTTVPKIFTVPGEFRRQAIHSDVVFARSAYEKIRITEGLGIPADKVRVVLNGVDAPAAPDPGLARRVLGFDGDFVLHLSSYCQPRKNVVRLIEAIGPTKIPLVLAGTTEDNDVLARVRELEKIYPSVRRLGFLSAAERDAVLNECHALALPSLHEGTGLAALEAAACGAAVVITDRGGAYDYFQDRAAYVDPYDTAAIRRATQDAFARPRDPALAGHVRTQLTWDRSARQLVAAYGLEEDASCVKPT